MQGRSGTDPLREAFLLARLDIAKQWWSRFGVLTRQRQVPETRRRILAVVDYPAVDLICRPASAIVRWRFMHPLPEFLGSASGVAAIRERLARLVGQPSASGRLPCVLLLGETGTGKGLLARSLHRASARAAGPFVDVDCAAIPETLVEAELFGFERGAFTDARQAKPGLLQAAHGGTIFLDEIGLLPRALQAKLVKTIEERVVRRLGSARGELVDIWVMSATNEDLLEATREGRFRLDLYHRLAGLTVELPALRERGQDVLLLAQSYLDRACVDHGMAAKHLSPDARDALLAHPWPGNVRELINVMERVALLAEGSVVAADDLGLASFPSAPGQRTAPRASASQLKRERNRIERERMLGGLRLSEWNITQAAARLSIPRTTLQYGMRKYGLQRDTSSRRQEPGASSSLPPSAPTDTPRTARPADAQPVGLGVGGRLLTPLVGRERELAFMAERLRTCQAGRGQVVGITGEPGAGKSRLLYQFRESLEPGAVDYVEGRCLSHGNSIPLLPILDFLRNDLGITSSDTPSGIEDKTRRRFQDSNTEPSESMPYLLWLLGVRERPDGIAHLSPAAIEGRALETLRSLFIERSRRRAVVLALEDLHWIDEASEEFLGSLMDAISGSAILFLATYRPGYRPPWIERSYVTQLALPLLSAPDPIIVAPAAL
jgi:two-component system, NtrC family, response regulator AtoC